MAPTRKEKTKTDLDHALRRCIDKREELQEALEDQSATLSIEEIKSDLDELNEKWECVVTANFSGRSLAGQLVLHFRVYIKNGHYVL